MKRPWSYVAMGELFSSYKGGGGYECLSEYPKGTAGRVF